MESKHLLHSLVEEVKEIIAEVEEMTSTGSGLIEKKPAEDKWSIRSCIEHLNLTGNVYLPRMQKQIARSLAKKQVAPPLFKEGIIGKFSVKSMKPQPGTTVPKPMKTFKILDPYRNPEPQQRYLNTFIDQQNQLIELLTLAQQVDLNQNRINSALGPLVRFKLGDAFRFVIAHEQRHVLQMKRTLALLN
jgi:hypothetical protein